jgi:hypothetical protein
MKTLDLLGVVSIATQRRPLLHYYYTHSLLSRPFLFPLPAAAAHYLPPGSFAEVAVTKWVCSKQEGPDPLCF